MPYSLQSERKHVEPPAEDLAIQYAFAREYAVCRDVAKSYRAAVGKPDKDELSDFIAKSRGKELAALKGVREMIAEAEAEMAEIAGLDLPRHIACLQEIKDRAMGAKDYSTAFRIQESMGKACGLYVDRHSVEVRHIGEIDDEIRQIAAQYPELVADMQKMLAAPVEHGEVLDVEYSVAESVKHEADDGEADAESHTDDDNT